MWNNYFYNIQKKYSMRISSKKPLVIRLDGKEVTRNKNINLFDCSDNGFLDALKKTASFFTQKYSCYAIFGSDEISFIFPSVDILLPDLDSDKTTLSNEIVSVFSQYFFQYFNNFDKHRILFWHAKCFSIPNEKIVSYVKYRSKSIENVLTTYFLIRNGITFENDNIENRRKKCESVPSFSTLSNHIAGFLYLNGKEISLNDFLNGSVIYTESDNNDAFSNLM